MNIKRLFILVEGLDDERFVRRVLERYFNNQYRQIKIVRYAHKTQKQVNRLLISIERMSADYILLTDMDHSPCVTQRKQKTIAKFSCCDKSHTQVVVQEIEGWYLAGLDDNSSQKLKLPRLENTNHLVKERFDAMVPKKTSHRDLMIEILKLFSIKTARQKNDSFRYFLKKNSILA